MIAIQRLNTYILYAEGLSKGTQATQSVKWNEIYKWKDYMKYPGYEPELRSRIVLQADGQMRTGKWTTWGRELPKANMDYIIRGHRPSISTLDHHT